MSNERGASVGDYRAPLFIAWQLTNRCSCRCLHCCEESGPDKAWPDEFSEEEALRLARSIGRFRIPYVAFGGGEPLGVPHVWKIFEILREEGSELKIETDGLAIDELAADRLKELDVQCVQVSVEGATAETHERVRPGGDFQGAVRAMERLSSRDLPPEFVFVPTRHNIHEAAQAYELAVKVGARTFVTGPMMRLGRAALSYEELAPTGAQWEGAVAELNERADAHKDRTRLAVYPWDILAEMEKRLESPQAMLLVVPNGRAKLLNALPFAPGDLRKQSVIEAWEAYKRAWASDEVKDFVSCCRRDPSLLRHANETWEPGRWSRMRPEAAA